MSLKAFHFIFIMICVLFALYLGLWCMVNFIHSDRERIDLLGIGIGAFMSSVGLVWYGACFLQKHKKIGGFF
jgi:hypothetical protein